NSAAAATAAAGIFIFRMDSPGWADVWMSRLKYKIAMRSQRARDRQPLHAVGGQDQHGVAGGVEARAREAAARQDGPAGLEPELAHALDDEVRGRRLVEL